MIHQSSVTEAVLLTQELDARRLILTAQAGTPLSELTQTFGVSQTDLTQVGAKDYIPDATYLTGLSNNFGGNLRGEVVKHTVTLDTLSSQIGKFIQGHLKYAKTVVKPLIVELAEEFKKDIAAIEFDPYKNTQVVLYDLPTPVLDPSFQEEILKFKNIPARPELKHLSLPVLAASQLADKLTTAQSGLDKEIQNWYGTKGEAFLQLVWNAVFTDSPDGQNFNTLTMGDDRLDVCLAVYLLASKLHNDPPEGVKVSLGTYNTDLLDLKAQAALRLSFAIDTYKAFVDTGMLIKSYNQQRIEVVGEVYRKWIQAGGNNAMVLAATLMSTVPLHVNQIDEQKQALEKRWERHVAMLQTTMENKRFVRYKEILKQRAIVVVNENFKDIYGAVTEDLEARENIAEHRQFHLRLTPFIQGLCDKDFANVWDLSMRLVCDCVFYFTDAKKILKGIDAAIEKNPKLDINEAAFLSLIEYVSDYVFDQVELKGI